MTRWCSSCPRPIGRKNKSGRCAPCASADPDVRAKKGRLTPEQRERRIERCRALSADPAIVAKRSKAVRAAHAKPEVQARHAAACRAAKLRYMEDPAAQAKLRAAGLTVGRGNLERGSSPEARARAAAKVRERAIAWCPEPYRPLAAELKRKGKRLAERQQLVADRIAADERARLAEMTPFERQLARVAAGAQLVAKPDLRALTPAYTLGGVASGLL